MKLRTCSRLLVTILSFPVSATAPDVTHEAVDIEQASGGKIIVENSAGTTCKSSGRECEDKTTDTRRKIILIGSTEILCFSVSGEGLRLSTLVQLLFLDYHLKPPFLLPRPCYRRPPRAGGIAALVIRVAAGVAQAF